MLTQIVFTVKGLPVPIEGVAFGRDILMKGIPDSALSYIFIKKEIAGPEDHNKFAEEALFIVTNFILAYGLTAKKHIQILNFIIEDISSQGIFGDTETIDKLKVMEIIDARKRQRNGPQLIEAMKKSEALKDILASSKQTFLKNAVFYYYRSLGDLIYQQQMIDIFISLESLFSHQQETRYRISLRANSLLNAGATTPDSNIFKTIYKLYDKRSKIVHGTEDVRVDPSEIAVLRNYVENSIGRLMRLKMPKDKMLILLDESLYDKNKKQLLDNKLAD